MRRSAKSYAALAAALLAMTGLAAPAAAQQAATDFRARLPQDEVIYFLLPDRFDNADPSNDRGGLTGDRSVTGYDPTAKGWYHGGDLKGVTRRLDYIQGLGATAIWVAPIFKNKAVQGGPGQQSAGYHGYWITDFTQVDPHFGTNQDFADLVAAAHKRGMKVYMDIVVNHTADVIQYRECVGKNDCPYRSRADYPYQRRGGVTGPAINAGFAGDQDRSPANFAHLTDPSYAYTPFVPEAEKAVKVPAWLNDPIYYHNRGNTTFADESATMGDFSGLDDLMTENPRVLAGMIDIYGGWIDRFGIDGFRIDTARHVEPAFWQAFVPAMQARAKAKGIPNFHIFGEVAYETLDVGLLARHTVVDQLPGVLDFATRQAILESVTGKQEPGAWDKLTLGDALYAHGYDTAVQLPTFVSNHDAGRLAMAIRSVMPLISDDELLQRVRLAHAMLLTLRGVPTIYAGDEQGFVGDGNDQDAREDQFGSKTASYNDNHLLGTTTTTATPHFGRDHPLYREIAALAKLRTATPALTRGTETLRARSDQPGLVALSRIDPATGAEVLLAFNTATKPLTREVEVGTAATGASVLAGGGCAARVSAPGSLSVTLAPLSYAICALKADR
ncbi:alpha-amylase [Sphingomonas sp. MA1305]|uniref:alpha-amylase family glycosyl hydrolase n=1 Tax=Sphingomonas sp. MA1305 TaxID=2479204 RepID=UPI0018DEF660|nr:alpha-amylase [Sphingomonas sp. MA1305]